MLIKVKNILNITGVLLKKFRIDVYYKKAKIVIYDVSLKRNARHYMVNNICAFFFYL